MANKKRNPGMVPDNPLPDASQPQGAAGIDDPAVQAVIQKAVARRIQQGRGPASVAPDNVHGRMEQPMPGTGDQPKQPSGSMDERAGASIGMTPVPDTGAPAQMGGSKMTPERLRKAAATLNAYKTGKASVDKRIIEAQKWWKGKNWEMIQQDTGAEGMDMHHRNTKWLWNSLVGKHADAMDSFPEPIVLPRAQDDVIEADNLTNVIPVILDQNKFEAVYSECQWDKMIEGTAGYSITWDSHKYHGLGDISVGEVNLLNLFWEPGIDNIQQSTNVFHVALVDNELLHEMYPQTQGHLGKASDSVNKYPTDDHVSQDGKSLVVDWYYHKYDTEQDRQVLHFCKFVEGICLYCTEDDQGDPMNPAGTVPARDGLYNDGMFPFVLDPLYPVKGSPCGYGYVDIGKDIQTDIDIISEACVTNAAVNARPRYMGREDSGVNEQEFLDTRNAIVHYSGSVDSSSFFPITTPALPGNTVNFLQSKVEELKFITGNADVNNGSTPAGVTAAAAIQALKEDSGRSSKDSNRAAFRAYKEIVLMVIERIRQFYTESRIFRIKGQDGSMQFVTYNNAQLVPQDQGQDFGIDMGIRVPEFDIDVHVQREDAYTRLSQNELAIQLYNMGAFQPQMAPMVVQLLDMMDFKGKDELIQKIQKNGDLFNMLMQVLQIAYELALQAGDQNAAAQLTAIAQQLGMPLQTQDAPQMMDSQPESSTAPTEDEHQWTGNRQDTILQKASERAQNATRPT